MRFRALGLPGWDSRSVDTVSDTSDTPAYDELCSSPSADRYSANLNDDTNDHDTGSEENGLSTTKVVSEGKDEDGTKKATDRIDRDDEPFIRAVALDLWKG